jgi:hypothetical protein
MKRIPSVIYEAMPYVYLLVGIWAVSVSLSWLGTFCALLLISAGGFIIKLRLDYRTPHKVMLRELSGGRRQPSNEADEAAVAESIRGMIRP